MFAKRDTEKKLYSDFFKMNKKDAHNSKKGISPIIASTIMIGLVIVAVVVVWSALNNLVEDRISTSESCFGIFEKVRINDKYTCYDDSSSKVNVSIIRDDIDMEGLTVSISDGEDSDSFTINSSNLPGKRGGKTYVFSWSRSTTPSGVRIAPIIGGNQCDVSDSTNQLLDCDLI